MIALFNEGSSNDKQAHVQMLLLQTRMVWWVVGKLGDHAVDDDLVNDNLDLLDDPSDSKILTFIIEGSYVPLYNAPKSLELFYLLKVVRKTVADIDKIYIYSDTIQNGSEYIEGYYLEKVK